MFRLLSLSLVLLAATAAAEPPPAFNVYLEHGGVYQITWERLHAAGLPEVELPSDAISVTNLGWPVPVYVDDGGDGLFGPGDRIELVAEPLRGDHSYLDEHSRFNCYRVRFDEPAGARGAASVAVVTKVAGETADLQARRHLEQDLLMVRFRESPGHEEERWYWARLSSAAAAPTLVPISLGGRTEGEVQLTLGVRGWSEPRHREAGAIPHHRLEAWLGPTMVGVSEWNGTRHHSFQVTVPEELAAREDLDLALRVPRRSFPESAEPLIDVVLLNWIEVSYRASASPLGTQVERWLAAETTPGEVEVELDGHGPSRVYTADGTRLEVPEGAAAIVLPSPGDGRWHLVADGGLHEPDEVVFDRPSLLRSPGRPVDYIMITHRSLAAALEPLADFHRGRGLEVEVVDVQDVYDEFNHGILHPRSLRDFLAWAYHEWPQPAPRFVLLAGDASWDAKNAEADDRRYADWTYQPNERAWFVKNASSPYGEGLLPNNRNLVPTWSYPTYEGNAASDNWLAAVAGDDDLPDFAIGRIPAATPEELAQVVAKTIGYATNPELGPWRRELLFITNESAGFQRSSDRAAEAFEAQGYVSHKIYPHPSEPANELHTRHILERMDDGVRAIVFLGHGGRYIWRTGPPDLKKNHDLFTLEHLDELAPSRRLPVVLSLTCYSAPFDHPTADSIGEKLLRIPDRGAIAVLAASWRNSPSSTMGEILIEELSLPGTTIGEAVQRAKARIKSPILVQTYNLLGDPAAPMAVPSAELELAVVDAGGDRVLEVRSSELGGRADALVEWVSADGSVVASRELVLDGATTRVGLADAGAADPFAVRVYAWDSARGLDGAGWLQLTAPVEKVSTAADRSGNTDREAS